MTFPYISALTAGAIVLLQTVLAISVSHVRNQVKLQLGQNNDPKLVRAIRRHGNLAENSALFLLALTILELFGLGHILVIGLCAAFLIARVSHAIGFSIGNTENPFRMFGALVTYLLGFIIGGLLIYVGCTYGTPTVVN